VFYVCWQLLTIYVVILIQCDLRPVKHEKRGGLVTTLLFSVKCHCFQLSVNSQGTNFVEMVAFSKF